ncbi:MAG: DUF4402 domain-containing protein [Catenulispora sp.]
MRFTVYLAAAAATLAAATPAVAQQTGSVTTQAWAKGTVVQPVTLTWQQDLDFGTVVSTATAGNVVINANTGGRTFPSGGPIGVPSYPGDRGLFQGAGTAGQVVQLTLNAPTSLISTANPLDTITVNSMVLDTCGCTTDSRTIGASGVFNVGVGGDFQIGVNQPAALYRARFDVTAVYP